MILTSFINELKRLDDMETEIFKDNPVPIIYSDEITEQLNKIHEYQGYMVMRMAHYLGYKFMKDNKYGR